MDALSEILHNPSFKKDFAFIKQLENNNSDFQDKIWEKFVSSYSKNERNDRKVNNRFDSHPSSFSSESEGFSDMEESLKDEPKYILAAAGSRFKTFNEKGKSSSSSKVALNESSRKKLRKKLTQHLQNGTLDKFEVKNIGDFIGAHSVHEEKEVRKPEDEIMEKDVVDEKSDEIEEVYFDRWRNAENSSDSSTIKDFPEIKDVENVPPTPPPKLLDGTSEEEIQELRKEQQVKSKVKIKEKGYKDKVHQGRDSKKKSLPAVNVSAELKKSRHYIEKSIGTIKDIRMILNQGTVPPDGSDDHTRRHIRTKEFSSRFSRIYMYPLVRHLSQINTTVSSEKYPGCYSKFTTMYQLIFQALQACFNHLPSAVGTSSYHKLKEHLTCTVEVCDKNSKYFDKELNNDNEDYVSILKSQCVDLMSKLDDNFLSPSISSLLKARSTSLVPVTQPNKTVVLLPATKGNVHRRFSMYTTNMASKRDKQWKKMLESLEGRKPKVKSRYRTATFKHRPPLEKHQIEVMVQPGKHRLDDSRSLTILRNTPVPSPLDEDSIQTMIQYERERCDRDEEESGREELEEVEEEVDEKLQGKTIIAGDAGQKVAEDNRHQPDDILTKLLQLVQDNDQQSAADPDTNLTNTIKVLQQCLNFKKRNTELFKKMDNHHQGLTVENSTMAIREDRGKKQKKEPTVTVTGTKNAQLICIKDDNSIISHASDMEESTKQNVQKSPPYHHTEGAYYSDTNDCKFEISKPEWSQTIRPTVTVTGTKNAQLICIKDDNSIISHASDMEESTKQNVPNNSPRKTLISAEVQTSTSGLEATKDSVTALPTSKSNIKIGRISRPRKMLELLPKGYAINVIQYKLAIHKLHRENYMYRKTSKVKPWEVMDKISEEILDYALLGIAKEIEVNELLENIYNAEFQY